MSTDLPRDYRQLQLTLSRIGYFRRGTLLKRFMPCGKPGCACQATPPRLHGPYYQWTRKVDWKTVTVRLSAEQAANSWKAGSQPAESSTAPSPKWERPLTARPRSTSETAASPEAKST